MSDIMPDRDLLQFAESISRLQDKIQSYINTNQEKNDPRMNDYLDRMLDFQNQLSDMKGEIGEQIGGLIIDQIDNAITQNGAI